MSGAERIVFPIILPEVKVCSENLHTSHVKQCLCERVWGEIVSVNTFCFVCVRGVMILLLDYTISLTFSMNMWWGYFENSNRYRIIWVLKPLRWCAWQEIGNKSLQLLRSLQHTHALSLPLSLSSSVWVYLHVSTSVKVALTHRHWHCNKLTSNSAPIESTAQVTNEQTSKY